MRMTSKPPRRAAAWLAALACGAGPAAAQPELDMVRDMLRLDTERALASERARQPARPAAAHAAPRADTLAVASIYGMRGALTAEVLINGRRKLYRQGAELPRGATSPVGEYRLRRIDDGCVYLEKGAGGLRAACFAADPALPGVPGRSAPHDAVPAPFVSPLPPMLSVPQVPQVPQMSSVPPLSAPPAPLFAPPATARP